MKEESVVCCGFVYGWLRIIWAFCFWIIKAVLERRSITKSYHYLLNLVTNGDYERGRQAVKCGEIVYQGTD